MWVQEEDIIRTVHDQEWLDRYLNICKKEYKPCKVSYLENCTIFSCGSWLDQYFENAEAMYGTYLGKGSDVVDLEEGDLELWGELATKGYEHLPTYGVVDFIEDETKCLDNLFKMYPELLCFAKDKNKKYAMTFSLATDDFRFHKNGGYRGEDEVGEYVCDSPSKEYLLFSVIEVK